jgi:acyl-homoserine-lactone acylase
METRTRLTLAACGLALAGLLAACAQPGPHSATERSDRAALDPSRPAALIARTANGVPHIVAPDLQTLGYGVAYAFLQDNVCLSADHLLTVRGERARWLGSGGVGELGRRRLPNEQVDAFVGAMLDDAALLANWQKNASADAKALIDGYVAGYNRFLVDRGSQLPAPCGGQPWVLPLRLVDVLRSAELSAMAGVSALAQAVVGARPPAPAAAQAPSKIDRAAAERTLREWGVIDPPLGSNAWAFGRETTADGSGLLLGNPHFPWTGINRFWQLHLTVPGQLDVMGAAIGWSPVVQIGFNRDVAWSHTVSTGKRFTIHELTLVPGQPTSYVVDGQPVAMLPKAVAYRVRSADGTLAEKTATVWTTRYGPVMVLPQAGLGWTAQRAYAIQDANAGNLRGYDTWLAMNRARNVHELRAGAAKLGAPWVNTLAADRAGNAMYADLSVVPDVSAALLARCAPSPQAAGLFRSAAGLVVLDGSKGDCQWARDASSPQPGVVSPARLPVVVRGDWVQNSNDSYLHTQPQQRFDAAAFSPLIGDAVVRRARTRASYGEIAELLAGGKVSAERIQQRLFENRSFTAGVVLPDLLAACEASPAPAAWVTLAAEAAGAVRESCAVLKAWDRRFDPGSRGAMLYREFWSAAAAVPGVWRVPANPADPVATPAGLKLGDAEVAAKVWNALAAAAAKLRGHGLALDVPVSAVQRAALGDGSIGVHGGIESDGVLNNVGNQFAPGLGPRGWPIDYGTSYVQTVRFDARGPVAHALLTYGQSSDPASPHATDQLHLYAEKRWPRLPFHADEIARERVGEVLRLARP